MRTEYSDEKKKQWEPIPEPLLGALYTSSILAAPISLTTHVLFYRKEKLPGIYVQFSFRKKKHILSFSKNKNRPQKQKAEKKSEEQIRKQG